MRQHLNTIALVCPACHRQLKPVKESWECKYCRSNYPIKSGIPILLTGDSSLEKSRLSYEQMHKNRWMKITDGSYDFFAALARGNKTVDIACGEAMVGQLAPTAVSVDFSLNALKKAKTRGVKNLICASAEHLPFANDIFDIAICAGSLEHFPQPQRAINEMARVSRMQIVTAHRSLSLPFFNQLRSFITTVYNIENQPREYPLSWGDMETLYRNAKLQILFKGVWTYPTNLRLVFPFLPERLNPPSCHFVVSIKK